MKRTLFLMIAAAFLFSLVGCPDDSDRTRPEPKVWQVSFEWEELTLYHSQDMTASRSVLEITLTNTGNQRMEDMIIGLVTDHPFDFSVDETGIPGLDPGEAASFNLTLPFRDQSVIYEARLVAGNKIAGARLDLRYGVFELVHDPNLTLSPALLQVGETDSVVFSTTDPGDTGVWISSMGNIEGDRLFLSEESGDLYIGFLISESPFRISGRRIIVYPAIEEMNIVYTLADAPLIRNHGGTATPLNFNEIRNNVTSGTNLNFEIEDDGNGILSFIHPTSGEITFSGEDGDSASVTVIGKVVRTVAEGVVTVFRGISTFTAKIGVSPAPVLIDAGTVNTAAALQTFVIELSFDQSVNAGVRDARNGFTITKAPAEQIAIQQAVIANNVITFTLASPIVLGDEITLSYDKELGGIQNAGNTPLDNIANFPVANNLLALEPGPEMLSAVIDGSTREDARRLIITYDKRPFMTNVSGFSVGNTTGSAIGFTAWELDADDHYTVILTMSRIPMWSEVEADNLTLIYNAALGTVTDLEGRSGLSGTLGIELKSFDEDEYKPPVVESVSLDGAFPTSLVIEWDKPILSASGFGGFTLSGATPAITFTASSVYQKTQTLTMSRAPLPNELDHLRLSYSAAIGNTADTSSNLAESFINKVVDVTNPELIDAPPVPISAAINAVYPTLLVLTFDDDVAITSSTGFSVSGSLTATSFTPAVSGSGTSEITFTLNRKPAFGETMLISYSGLGNALHSGNANIRVSPFADMPVTLEAFSAENDSRPVLESIIVDANRDNTGASFEQARYIYLTFDRAVNAVNQSGFNVTGSDIATLITDISGSGTNVLTLTLNVAASESEIANVRLSYNMDLGNLNDGNDNLVLSFDNAIEFRNYNGLGENADTERPWLVSATIENATPSIVQVVFSERVHVDRTKFVVKVNTVPRFAAPSGGALNRIPMDNAALIRTITSATPVGSAPSNTWNMTMSGPAQFGEILRLATATADDGVRASTIAHADHLEGAATDMAGNQLLAVTQFIIRSLVERPRRAFEIEAGLFRNGVRIAEVTDGAGGQMYQNALAHLASSGNTPRAGDEIILVLPGNQTYTGGTTFTGGQVGASDAMRENPPMLIITTPIGTNEEFTITVTGHGNNSFGFVARNGLTLVLDENVVMTRAAAPEGTRNSSPLVALMDGGKMILNGGALRNNVIDANMSFDSGGHRGGAIRVQGGSWGAYLLINGGDISGNSVIEASDSVSTGAHGGAGAVYLLQYGVLIMHGGAINNNTYVNNSDHEMPRAGAVADRGTEGSTNHAQSAFFMTGGEIAGNTVSGSSRGVRAGGVLVSGVFQKNGGTIFGADAADAAMRNQSLMTGDNNVNANAIAVIMNPVRNPSITGDTPQARLRDFTSGPAVSLFIESSKATHGSAGANFVPLWAQSFWDN